MRRNQKQLPGCINCIVTGVLVGLMASPDQHLLAQSFSPPTVLYRTVNDGAAQRSVVTNLSAIFSTNVSLSPQNLVLRDVVRNTSIDPTNFSMAYDAARNQATWTFPGLPGGSLPDGNYTAAIVANAVTNAAGVPFDGNGDGLSGDPHVFDLFRLFGDWNGDRDVDFLDNHWFQKSRESNAPVALQAIFNAQGRGPTDPNALAHFRSNYFTVLPTQPAIFAALLNDTGVDPWDHVTYDPSAGGTVIRTNPSTTVEARLSRALDPASFVDITGSLSTNGTFRFLSNHLATIRGAAIDPGPYVLALRTREPGGDISATFELPFTMEGQVACSFTNGWIARVSSPGDGTVRFINCEAILSEGDSFRVSIERTFVIPTSPAGTNRSALLCITFAIPDFDTTATNAMRDAFEAALVDGNGRPLTYTIQRKRRSSARLPRHAPSASAQSRRFLQSH